MENKCRELWMDISDGNRLIFLFHLAHLLFHVIKYFSTFTFRKSHTSHTGTPLWPLRFFSPPQFFIRKSWFDVLFCFWRVKETKWKIILSLHTCCVKITDFPVPWGFQAKQNEWEQVTAEWRPQALTQKPIFVWLLASLYHQSRC